VKVPPVSIVDS
jgi:cysteine synthase